VIAAFIDDVFVAAEAPEEAPYVVTSNTIEDPLPAGPVAPVAPTGPETVLTGPVGPVAPEGPIAPEAPSTPAAYVNGPVTVTLTKVPLPLLAKSWEAVPVVTGLLATQDVPFQIHERPF
jgi:hypothetical protein